MSFTGSYDGLRVDHTALDTASQGMLRIVKAIDAVLEDLVSDLTPLVNQWDGETKKAFADCQRVWDEEMHKMETILASAANQLNTSNSEYRAVDAANAAKFDF